MSDRAVSEPAGTSSGGPDLRGTVGTGIVPMDERFGGLVAGGSYLVVALPGPAKLVVVLHFLQAGLARGERGLLLTNASARDTLDLARAWGIDLDDSWAAGVLRIVGFKDDFELRAARSLEPDEVIEELDLLVGSEPVRIAVDPGTLFLGGGARSALGSAFLAWARKHPATACTTFSVDGPAASLPASAEWLAHATTGQLVVEARAEDLYEISLAKSVPDAGDREQAISVQLKPGAGLVRPETSPTRRDRDRAGIDTRRLLLVSLGGSHTADLETWARDTFVSDVVSEPFEAVANAQGQGYGGVLVHAPRSRIREAISACRALRPLTRAAIVFASDDAIRANDRVRILESGADDCLSGGVALQELELRLRQAIASGAKPHPNGRARDDDGLAQTASAAPPADMAHDKEHLSRQAFGTELQRFASDPKRKFFCLVVVSAGALDPDAVAEILTQQVRTEEGDLIGKDSDRCFVLLQNARETQLGHFLTRLRSRLAEAAGGAGTPQVTVLSHPTQAEQIEASLRTGGGARA